ncbi:MAG: DUF389 domain-containing protein [Flavobacteriales bacterium]|nr:DUF389 domain-containing protein [Flavobacteriales bacterium]
MEWRNFTAAKLEKLKGEQGEIQHEMEEKTDSGKQDNTSSAEEPKLGVNVKFLRMLVGLRDFARSTMFLGDDMDQEGTIETIKKDMVFRGYVVWILICSIFIASIGLNLNSTAVIIGAMLISPLMAPILAIGLSVGTNDWETLKRALKNFGVMVVVALMTSTIYFLVTPLREAQPELLARTSPTFLDALIAIFGGLAGIIGISRRTRGNVIPGVAIATALMPPLCTAGYGLANGEWSFFFGAFYLFTLNSIFIALSTFIIVRYLKFPLVSFVNVDIEKKVKRYMIVFVIVVILPSAWIFYGVVKETLFLGKAENFIAQNLSFEGTEILSKKITYTDTISRIDVFVMGEPIADQTQQQLETIMLEKGLKNTILAIHQPKDISTDIAGKLSKEVRVGILEDLFKRNEDQINAKDARIAELESEVVQYQKSSIPFEGVNKEISTLYPAVDRMAYAVSIEMNGKKLDTIPTFLLRWKTGESKLDIEKNKLVMQAWLKQRLDLDTLRVVEF